MMRSPLAELDNLEGVPGRSQGIVGAFPEQYPKQCRVDGDRVCGSLLEELVSGPDPRTLAKASTEELTTVAEETQLPRAVVAKVEEHLHFPTRVQTRTC